MQRGAAIKRKTCNEIGRLAASCTLQQNVGRLSFVIPLLTYSLALLT